MLFVITVAPSSVAAGCAARALDDVNNVTISSSFPIPIPVALTRLATPLSCKKRRRVNMNLFNSFIVLRLR
jgi:hypothetical protein